MKKITPRWLMLALFLIGGCNLYLPDESSLPLPPAPAPSGDPSSGAGPAPTPFPAPSPGICENPGPDEQCLALKIVAYQLPSQDPTLTQIQAEAVVVGINRVWKPCGLGFSLERFEVVDPGAFKLNYSPDWRSESEQIRTLFRDDTRFLVVAVGPWSQATIAVTQMPGVGPYGVLVEKDYASNPLTVGHELGHYMGLYHYRDTSNLMNPYIGSSTEGLTSGQCGIAPNTNQKTWPAMFRNL